MYMRLQMPPQSRKSEMKVEMLPSGCLTPRVASSQVANGCAKQHSIEQRRTQTLCRLRVILGAGREYM